MQEEMAAAHARDSADERKFRDLSRALAAFLKDPPHRLHSKLDEQLCSAKREIDDLAAHIVAVWD